MTAKREREGGGWNSHPFPLPWIRPCGFDSVLHLFIEFVTFFVRSAVVVVVVVVESNPDSCLFLRNLILTLIY